MGATASRSMGGQQQVLYAAGGLGFASSGVHLPDESLELDAPPRELLAHAQLEAEALEAFSTVDESPPSVDGVTAFQNPLGDGDGDDGEGDDNGNDDDEGS